MIVTLLAHAALGCCWHHRHLGRRGDEAAGRDSHSAHAHGESQAECSHEEAGPHVHPGDSGRHEHEPHHLCRHSDCKYTPVSSDRRLNRLLETQSTLFATVGDFSPWHSAGPECGIRSRRIPQHAAPPLRTITTVWLL